MPLKVPPSLKKKLEKKLKERKRALSGAQAVPKKLSKKRMLAGAQAVKTKKKTGVRTTGAGVGKGKLTPRAKANKSLERTRKIREHKSGRKR